MCSFEQVTSVSLRFQDQEEEIAEFEKGKLK